MTLQLVSFQKTMKNSVKYLTLIAAGFHAKSAAGINVCVGATDGLLIWLLCVTEKEAKTAGAGQSNNGCRNGGDCTESLSIPTTIGVHLLEERLYLAGPHICVVYIC